MSDAAVQFLGDLNDKMVDLGCDVSSILSTLERIAAALEAKGAGETAEPGLTPEEVAAYPAQPEPPAAGADDGPKLPTTASCQKCGAHQERHEMKEVGWEVFECKDCFRCRGCGKPTESEVRSE